MLASRAWAPELCSEVHRNAGGAARYAWDNNKSGPGAVIARLLLLWRSASLGLLDKKFVNFSENREEI